MQTHTLKTSTCYIRAPLPHRQLHSTVWQSQCQTLHERENGYNSCMTTQLLCAAEVDRSVCVCVCVCVCARACVCVWLCQFVVVSDPLREEAQLSVVVRRWASPSLYADPVVVNLTPLLRSLIFSLPPLFCPPTVAGWVWGRGGGTRLYKHVGQR